MADWTSGFQALNDGLRFRAQQRRQDEQDQYQRQQDELVNQQRSRMFDLQDRDFKLRQDAQKALEGWRKNQHDLAIDQQLADQSAKVMELGLKNRPIALQPPTFHTQKDPFGNDVTFMRTYKPDGSAADSVYTPKEANDTKDLTSEELKRIDAIRQAKSNIQMFRSMYDPEHGAVDPNMGGPIAGRWAMGANALGWTNPNYVRASGMATAAVPNLARGVFGEVGVLTDKDVARYQGLVPTYYDTAAQRMAKLALLDEYIKDAESGMSSTFKAAGRNVGALGGSPGGDQGPLPRFNSLAEAQAAGVQRAEVWDDTVGKYRLVGWK
jgi:hypothetical protein